MCAVTASRKLCPENYSPKIHILQPHKWNCSKLLLNLICFAFGTFFFGLHIFRIFEID